MYICPQQPLYEDRTYQSGERKVRKDAVVGVEWYELHDSKPFSRESRERFFCDGALKNQSDEKNKT